jgi:hypothetical protein
MFDEIVKDLRGRVEETPQISVSCLSQQSGVQSVLCMLLTKFKILLKNLQHLFLLKNAVIYVGREDGVNTIFDSSVHCVTTKIQSSPLHFSQEQNANHLLNNFIVSRVYIHIFCCFRKRLYSFRRIAWMLMKPVASLGVKSECLSMETRSSLYNETGDHRPKTVTKTYSSW